MNRIREEMESPKWDLSQEHKIIKDKVMGKERRFHSQTATLYSFFSPFLLFAFFFQLARFWFLSHFIFAIILSRFFTC